METLLNTQEIVLMRDRGLTPVEIERIREFIKFEQDLGFQTTSWVRVARQLQLPFRSVAREAKKILTELGTPAASSSASPTISIPPLPNPNGASEDVPPGIPQPSLLPKACVSGEVTTSPKRRRTNEAEQTQDGVIVIDDDDYTVTQIERWKRDAKLYNEACHKLGTMQIDCDFKNVEFEILQDTCNRLKEEVKQIRTNYNSKVEELDQLQEAYDQLVVKYDTKMNEREAEPPDTDELVARKLQVTSLFIVSSGSLNFVVSHEAQYNETHYKERDRLRETEGSKPTVYHVSCILTCVCVCCTNRSSDFKSTVLGSR
jgi:hypothetical protein